MTCPCDCGCEQRRECFELTCVDACGSCHCVRDSCLCEDADITSIVAGAEKAMIREGSITPPEKGNDDGT